MNLSVTGSWSIFALRRLDIELPFEFLPFVFFILKPLPLYGPYARFFLALLAQHY